jgi:hypothetical protein
VPAPNRPGGGDRDLSAPDLGEAVRANEELTRQISDVEERTEALRARYDMWFIGIERREPSRERDELRREVGRLKTAFTHNTGLKFRIQTLHARFIAYERMWQRSAREKEEGTYRRDLLRARRTAKRDAAKAGAPPTPSTAAPKVTPPPAAAPARAAQATPQVPAAPAAAGVPGMTDAQLRALHAAYVDAKRRCNEDVSKLSLDALAKSVARQMPDLVQRFKGRAVDFRVVVKDGRAVLKASPK